MSESKNKLFLIKNFVPNFLTNHSLLPIFSGSNFLLHLIFFRPKNIAGPKIIKRKVWIKSLVETFFRGTEQEQHQHVAYVCACVSFVLSH